MTLAFSLLTVFVTLAGILSLADPISASPASQKAPFKRAEKCANIRVRKEWRDLTIDERVDYIRAVQCLQSKPYATSRAGVKTIFDQFQATHVDLTNEVHQVGQFLAWHRQFLTLYANALRDECGYLGPATYWDWTRDADDPRPIIESPVFDPVTGFGGDGVPGTYTPPPVSFPGFPGFPTGPFPTGSFPSFTFPSATQPLPTITSFTPPPATPTGFPPFAGFPTGGWPVFPGTPNRGCVGTGPFNTSIVRLGPGTAVGDHCLVRGIGEDQRSSVTSSNVASVLSQTNFENFRNALENGGFGSIGLGIHNGGHMIVGGLMSDPYASPGDPLFYLHHGNLDRIWWKWQSADLENRLYTVSGPTTWQANSEPLTLDFEMPFEPFSAPVKVAQIMDIEAEPNCFTYND